MDKAVALGANYRQRSIYAKLAAEHGATHEAAHWASAASQCVLRTACMQSYTVVNDALP